MKRGKKNKKKNSKECLQKSEAEKYFVFFLKLLANFGHMITLTKPTPGVLDSILVL